MVMPILIPADAAPWPRWRDLRHPPLRARPSDRWRRPASRRTRPRWPELSAQRWRHNLVDHWSMVAERCRPPPQPPLVGEPRMQAGCRDLLARCEALLRQMLRRRRRALDLSGGDLRRVANAFDLHTLRMPATSPATTAYLLASLHWCGCRHPTFLLAPPQHPPTGLVRWLAQFTVQDQVDYGRLLFARLVVEEQRVFEHAQRLVDRLVAMSASDHRGIVLLPELLQSSEPVEPRDWGIFTTRTYED